MNFFWKGKPDFDHRGRKVPEAVGMAPLSGGEVIVDNHSTSGYCYADDGIEPDAVGMLNLLRQYCTAERAMRAQTRGSMGIGESDMLALRFLLAAHQRGKILRQRDFAEELGISHASTSALIDRLCRDGHAERVMHPEDRRSVGIIPTEHSDREVRQILDRMHRRMLEAVEALSPPERRSAAKFLQLMMHSVADESTGHSPTAQPTASPTHDASALPATP